MSAVQYEARVERSTEPVWRSLYIWLISLPNALLGAVLITDSSYWVTSLAIAARASEGLLGAALATGVLALADELIRSVGLRHRMPADWWVRMIGRLLALMLSALNLMCRLSAGAASAVVPTGISLTVLSICLLLVRSCWDQRLAPSRPADDTDDEDLF